MKNTTYKEKALQLIEEVESLKEKRSDLLNMADVFEPYNSFKELVTKIQTLLYSYDPNSPLYKTIMDEKFSFIIEPSQYEIVKSRLNDFIIYLEEYYINDALSVKQKAENILSNFDEYLKKRYSEDLEYGFKDLFIDFKLLVYAYDPQHPINDYLSQIDRRIEIKQMLVYDSCSKDDFRKGILKFIDYINDTI